MMMKNGNEWMSRRFGGGGMWFWTVTSVLVVVLLVILSYGNGTFSFGL